MARNVRHTSVAGRTLLVLFFCAGIAFWGLLAGGEHRPAVGQRYKDPMIGYYPTDMPRYPGAREVPAGPAGSVGRAKVRMSVFSTKDDPAKVARFYAGFWQQRRLFVREDVTHLGGVVSAVDAGGGRIFQAMLVRRGERTMVFPSVTSTPLAAAETTATPPVPLFPDSKAVINLGSAEGGTRARVTLSVNSGTLRDNVVHYRRELRTAGYSQQIQQKPKSLGPKHHVLLFYKEGSEVTVNITELSEKRVRVHIMEVKS